MTMWIARSNNTKQLFLYGGKPRRINGHFYGNDLYGNHKTGGIMYPDEDNQFGKVTFENSPQEVEIKLKTK